MPALGPYDLHHRLGTGGMGEVWAATRRLPGGVVQDVVVKRVRPERADDADFRSRFLDEARIAARLTHPNLVRVVDFGEADGAWYLAMERVHGADLGAALKGAGGRLPVAVALYVAHEVGRGLTAAHTATDAAGRPLGLVHRDVCAANILLADDGRVLLTDFGVAALQADGPDEVVVGHRSTMSPEQAEGRPVDARSDVFSLGVVLYQMLAGGRPFGATEPDARRRRAAVAAVAPPSAHGAPGELDAVVMRALAVDPDDRYATAEAFRAALRRALSPSAPDLQAVALRAMLPGWLRLPAGEADEEAATVVATAAIRSTSTVAGLQLLETVASVPPDQSATVLDPLRDPAATPRPPDPAPPAPRRRRRPWALAALVGVALCAGGLQRWAAEPPPPLDPAAPVAPVATAPAAPAAPAPAPVAPEAPAPAAVPESRPAPAPAPVAAAAPEPAPTAPVDSPAAAPESRPAPAPAPSAAVPSAPVEPAPPVEAAPPAAPPVEAPPAAAPEAAPAPAAPEAAPVAPTTPATLTVRLSSNWGWLRIDGARVKGTSPFEDLELPPGRHTLRVETPSTGRVYHRTVTLEPGESRALTIEVD